MGSDSIRAWEGMDHSKMAIVQTLMSAWKAWPQAKMGKWVQTLCRAIEHGLTEMAMGPGSYVGHGRQDTSKMAMGSGSWLAWLHGPQSMANLRFRFNVGHGRHGTTVKWQWFALCRNGDRHGYRSAKVWFA